MTKAELLEKEKTWANEDQMSADCFRWAYNNYFKLRGLLFHVPNGGRRNMQEAAKFKAMGVTAGIPDYINLHRHVCGIELKMANGTVRDDQRKIHIAWGVNGIPVYICWSAAQWIEVIEKKILGI
jgi:hypothetical protein